MDGALSVVEEGVEVELLLTCGDIEEKGLGAPDTAQSCGGIEGSGASSILEAHTSDGLRIIVGDDKTTEGHITTETQRQRLRLTSDGDLFRVIKRIGEAHGIGELYLRGIGHGGVAITAVGHDHQLIGSFSELEGGCAEIIIAILLVDLLHTGTLFVVDCEVESVASLCYRSTCQGREGGMLNLEDADDERGSWLLRGLVRKVGVLAGEEHTEGQKERDIFHHTDIIMSHRSYRSHRFF